MSQSPTEPQLPASGSSVRRGSSTTPGTTAGCGCDIEYGPNGEISWRRMKPSRKMSIAAEFPEFSLSGIDRLRKAFEEFDADKDGHLGLDDLKLMMERLKAPQTHLRTKALLKEFGTDGDGHLDFRGFMALFMKAAAGQLDESELLRAWFLQYVGVSEVNVAAVGVGGAKEFFEAQIALQHATDHFQAQERAEQRLRQAEEEARQRSRENFNAKKAEFQKS